MIDQPSARDYAKASFKAFVAIEPDLKGASLQNIIILFYLASAGECTAEDIRIHTDIKRSSVGYHLKNLGAFKVRGVDKWKGLDLVEFIEDPYDRRKYTYKLSVKGRDLIDKYIQHLEETLRSQGDAS